VRSYLIALLKNSHALHQVPKSLSKPLSRKLKLLAIDRSLTEYTSEFSEMEKKVMNEHADQIIRERDRFNNISDTLRNLVRLARLSNFIRENAINVNNL
jgi:hypothetical protein